MVLENIKKQDHDQRKNADTINLLGTDITSLKRRISNLEEISYKG